MCCIIAIWQSATSLFGVPNYLLPEPLQVLFALKRGLIGGTLWPHLFATVTALFTGFAIGSIVALVVAAGLTESRTLDRMFYPIILAFQSMPKVALAPLIVVWFGFDLGSKIVFVSLITFFPVLVNTIAGLRAYPPDLEALYRAFCASRFQIFFRVKVLSAMSHIFAGLQIGIVLALLGTVVSELIAARRGLGFVIQTSALDFDVAMMFACIVTLSLIGLIASQTIRSICCSRVVFYRDTRGKTTTTSTK